VEQSLTTSLPMIQTNNSKAQVRRPQHPQVLLWEGEMNRLHLLVRQDGNCRLDGSVSKRDPQDVRRAEP
jgi:hypothetical protein